MSTYTAWLSKDCETQDTMLGSPRERYDEAQAEALAFANAHPGWEAGVFYDGPNGHWNVVANAELQKVCVCGHSRGVHSYDCMETPPREPHGCTKCACERFEQEICF